ncbi:MAG: alpha/beta fold hydrolase [Acidobacteriaceae bacterium]|nr:alpha/beta fold hydrolase [Acidobacteriaceae bacterium]MBV9497761.1 alpha/beta fold hydrolase [Acidobacteriaceae bacterium]
MPYATNPGVRIYWEEYGSGAPVLLIMGLGFTHEMWFRILPALSAQFRVIVFDNRGVGRSDSPPGPHLIREMAHDAAAVLDAAGIDHAQVVGASMGGMIAQELALRYPARVTSLLLGCSSHGGILARWPDLRKSCAIKWSKCTAVERKLSLIPLLYAPSTPRERIQDDIELNCRCNCPSRGFLNQLAGILLWSSYFRLPRITAPTLVAHGEQDCLIPIQNGRALASRIPGALFHPVAGAGHILTTDQPEASVELMLDFLGKHAGDSPRSLEPRATESHLAA